MIPEDRAATVRKGMKKYEKGKVWIDWLRFDGA
jgi:hypothetical protein